MGTCGRPGGVDTSTQNEPRQDPDPGIASWGKLAIGGARASSLGRCFLWALIFFFRSEIEIDG